MAEQGKNIERFDKLCHQIMQALVDNCPIEMKLTAGTFGLQQRDRNDQYAQLTNDEVFMYAALRWLADEQVIRRIVDGKNSYVGHVITIKGLELRNAVPASLKPRI